jgi:site-specific recombinase XerD
MLGQGVHPKIVSEMLGHATVAITLDLYAHATPAIIARLRAPWIRCSARPES